MSIFRRLSRWLGAHEGMTHIVAGNPAPNFSLRSLEGKDFSLAASLKSGPVVLAFFKVSCPVCKFTFPFLERLYQRYRTERVSGSVLTNPEMENVTFLAVSQDSPAAAAEFAKDFGISFPILTDDPGYSVSNAYGITMVPTVFLIEPDGTTRVSSMGFVKQDLETIADSVADRRNLTRIPVFLASESGPAAKPG